MCVVWQVYVYLACVCDTCCVLEGPAVGRGHISLRWELALKGLLPREVRANQYLGNHVGGRGGDLEVRNGQEKEGG